MARSNDFSVIPTYVVRLDHRPYVGFIVIFFIISCPAGWSSTEGKIQCEACNKGKFAVNSGIECEDCAVNTFQPQNTEPSTFCDSCPTGWNQNDTGKSFCIDLNYKKPSDCANNQYLDTSEDDPNKWNCETCPIGGNCVGHVTYDKVGAMFGWSQCPRRTSQNSSVKKFARCMFAPACLGGTNMALLGKYKINGSDNDPAQCDHENCTAECNLIAGYSNGSRLCGQCAEKYSHVGLTGKCDKCPDADQNTRQTKCFSCFFLKGTNTTLKTTTCGGLVGIFADQTTFTRAALS